MRKLFFVFIALCIGFTYSFASVFERPERGEMWYELPKKEEKKKKKVKKAISKKPPKKKTFKKKKLVKKKKQNKYEFPIKEGTPPVIAAFLKNPNEENAKEFLKWQAWYFNHIRKIGFTLQQTYRKYGPQIYNVVGYPENIIFANEYKNNGLEVEQYREIISQFKGRLGFIFFYKSTCPFCKEFLPIVSYLKLKYGLSIRGVAYDSVIEGLPFKSVVNPQLFYKYGIKQIPSLVAVLQKKDGSVVQGFVGVGYVPEDQIEQNILYFLYANGELQPKDINANYKYIFNRVR